MLILASASPRRRQLLQQLGLEFEVRPQSCRETSRAQNPADYVLEIALQKARAAQAQARPEDLILAADTAVCLGDRVLGKPADAQDARRMLALLSGRTHLVRTGLCLLKGGQSWRCQRHTAVTFRPLSAGLIDWYVSTGEPLDKAGAYGIQGKGALLVEKIEGDFYNVVGLPLAPLAQMLRQAGLPVFGPSDPPEPLDPAGEREALR